ncbi:MAG TPA: preprotein translocase subunit YajC [Clostridiales bacterium]|nr:preprotein translocase subunit YajC [Clostridiales bacterium]
MCLTLTGCAPGTAGEGGGTASSLSALIPLVVFFAIFYFFLIRPENKKRKKLQEMRDELAVGDEITTIGGIVGKIVHIKDEMITIETGEDRVRVQLMKWAISTKGRDTAQK